MQRVNIKVRAGENETGSGKMSKEVEYKEGEYKAHNSNQMDGDERRIISRIFFLAKNNQKKNHDSEILDPNFVHSGRAVRINHDCF